MKKTQWKVGIPRSNDFSIGRADCRQASYSQPSSVSLCIVHEKREEREKENIAKQLGVFSSLAPLASFADNYLIASKLRQYPKTTAETPSSQLLIFARFYNPPVL